MKTRKHPDKQLRNVELKDAMERRRTDRALNIKQFDLAAGISYSVARHWWQQSGFPTFYGVIFWSDFVEWRRTHVGLNSAKNQVRTDAPQPQPTARSRDEWLRSLPPRARRIMEESP